MSAYQAPDGWLNVAREVVRVKAGDLISVQVTGGFVRKQAPADGYVVRGSNGLTDLFVPEVVMPEHPAEAKLKRMRSRKR